MKSSFSIVCYVEKSGRGTGRDCILVRSFGALDPIPSLQLPRILFLPEIAGAINGIAMNHVPSLAGEIVPLRTDVIKIGKIV